MGRKGDLAKATVLNKLEGLYPNAIYLDKKLYVMEADENGEMVQIAISMTMPKNMVTEGEKIPKGNAAPWEVLTITNTPSTSKVNVETSAEEEAMIAKLMAELGIEE